jgi:GTP-binding protein
MFLDTFNNADICSLMEIKTAEYQGSYGKVGDCPGEQKIEIAFIGRSNVGKSSLINMLCNSKGLAKTSQRPGKTQCINFFTINDDWHLVDLPGYGYARASKTQRAVFSKMLVDYLTKRPQLVTALVLIDSNIPPQKIDLNFITFLGENRIPFSIVFTKTDRVKPGEVAKNVALFKRELMKMFDDMPNIFLSSAEKRGGKEEILDFIGHLKK